MAFPSKAYACLFSLLLSGCSRNITPIPPTHPFKIQGYPILVDDKPGDYDIIIINNVLAKGLRKKYCYFYKKTENKEHLFIYDLDCDLDSDRVMVLSRNEIVVATDTKSLDKKVAGMLDYILQNHKKNIFD